MRKLPPKFSLNVFGQRTQVTLVKNLALHFGCVGQYNPQNKTIQLESDQSNDELCKSLIHESIHAMAHRTGISQSISRELEEIFAESVSNLIFDNFNVQLK